MDHKPPALSRTLPKDFAYHPFDEPQTPIMPPQELEVPPPPNHSFRRLRRPRLDVISTLEHNTMPFCSPDVPLPSIEFSDESCSSSTLCNSVSTGDISPGFLGVPPRQRGDPKTPEAQVRDDAVSESRSWREDTIFSESDPVPRPSSACSNVSDSSVSSSGSFHSHPSFGGSCTSPECEIQDPFLTGSYSTSKPDLESPLKPGPLRNSSLQPPTGHRWTSEMDNHLWNTYQMYLQDPTITPFKTVPGSVPPLGVSYRVAREARRTWPRMKQKSVKKQSQDRQQRPNATAEKASETRSRSCTPVAGCSISKSVWPRSDSSTRKRLKQLCRRRFNIAPHYQRLLLSRSPSPFPELFIRSSSSSWSRESQGHCASNPFTRDLGVSLVATSLPSSIPEADDNTNSNVEAPNWFNNMADYPSAPAPQPQSSMHPLLSPINQEGAAIPRLGSPFMYHTWGPDAHRRHLRPMTSVNLPETVHATGSRLRSSLPPEMITTTHKRRAMNPLEDEVSPDRQSFPSIHPEQSHDSKGNPNYRRVRLRNRGATTCGLSCRERVDQLFTPPYANSNECSSTTTSSVSPPKEEIKRLGSPFSSEPRGNRPFKPRHAPSRSEPFIPGRPLRARASSLQNGSPFSFEYVNNPAAQPAPNEYFPEDRTTPKPDLHNFEACSFYS